MNIRTSDAEWGPNLVRVEYFDDAGEPYYCTFQPRDAATGSQAVSPDADADRLTGDPVDLCAELLL